MRRPTDSPTPRSQQGVTLLEVLITMVIASIGLLGFSALQTVTMKSNRDSLYESYATFYAYDILDCMRANRSQALAGDYDTDFADSAPTGSTVADLDLIRLKSSQTDKSGLVDNLPDGQIEISVDTSTEIATVSIQWKNLDTPFTTNAGI